MAKPKFELTADLVKVEPEASAVTYAKNMQELHDQQKNFEEPKRNTNVSLSAPRFETLTTNHAHTPRPLPQPSVSPIDQREEEREAISMKISKDLKKAFHLWCVQRGITMTDAIENAIKQYLQE